MKALTFHGVSLSVGNSPSLDSLSSSDRFAPPFQTFADLKSPPEIGGSLRFVQIANTRKKSVFVIFEDAILRACLSCPIAIAGSIRTGPPQISEMRKHSRFSCDPSRVPIEEY